MLVRVAAAQVPEPPSGTNEESDGTPAGPTHMPEPLRSSVQKVVVFASRVPADQSVSGSYAKDTPGLMGGVAAGSRLGRISKQVGPVPVTIPIPILTIPGAIFGGLSGAARREIQDFRDRLTEELTEAESPLLTDDGLALDVFWGLRKLPNLDSKILAPTAAIPEDTDALLYVSFNDVEIDVEGKEAIITTSAEATLRSKQKGSELYERVVRYTDRDTLRNWTANDNRLWRDYINYARHYLGREISAEVFDRIELQNELRPVATDTATADKKNERRFISRSLRPTLAWELTQHSDDAYRPWSEVNDESDIFYDVEIYDRHRLVYFEERVAGPRHDVAVDLEPCTAYRWSVRPAYHIAGDIRFGGWMRFAVETDADAATGNGLSGRQASAAPAYTQDFPSLETECGRR